MVNDSPGGPISDPDRALSTPTSEVRSPEELAIALAEAQAALARKDQQLEAAVTSLREAQSQLMESDKLSSLGELLAGVAHDINNPIGFILGNLIHINQYIDDLKGLVELYRSEYPNPSAVVSDEIDAIELDFLVEDLPKTLGSVRFGAERVRDIALALRNFVRSDDRDRQTTDIHELLDSAVLILNHRLKGNEYRGTIEVKRNYGDIPLIPCYPGPMNQVFMNLIGNAVDALDEYASLRSPRDLGSPPPLLITLSTKITTGDRIEISIHDSGPGIPEKIKSLLFESFFTTKPAGKGTGLGLAIVQQVVKDRHQGSVAFASTPETGTTFTLTLPIFPEDIDT
ncbi:MAG: ATP-binding protein [Cyanobacteria bacterium P01_C01_bin.89]